MTTRAHRMRLCRWCLVGNRAAWRMSGVGPDSKVAAPPGNGLSDRGPWKAFQGYASPPLLRGVAPLPIRPLPFSTVTLSKKYFFLFRFPAKRDRII